MYIFEVDELNELIVGFVFNCLIIFNLIIIYKRINKIKRMDVIYSNDFKRIFIGIVKYYEKSYKNTFIFEIDSIEKFKFEQNKLSNKYFNLKVELKNEEIKDICKIENEEDILNKILIALNEKLEKNEDIFANSIN